MYTILIWFLQIIIIYIPQYSFNFYSSFPCVLNALITLIIALVYEILYDGVYQLKDLPYAIDKMLHDKLPSNQIEYFMTENVERRKKQKERAKIFIETIDDEKDKSTNAVALKCKHHTDDMERASLLKESLSIFVFNRSLIQLENVCMNCLNVNSAKDLLDNGITPFPYKVAKALDPDIYRNIEFDVWSEMRKGNMVSIHITDLHRDIVTFSFGMLLQSCDTGLGIQMAQPCKWE